ncbi:glycoside hydrolase family 3 C-terminal domain-containing protein [Enterococcus timonensis]|uniref:glycoside hydrolase family 3 C-terminal domain-containing protein n=1 Tax=Enterococcus timonensis TaxID=1852364 RepID=UPI0008D9326D|nr:glycoside hydrolase family 3 C-terminal domain-containing protein [Enterococcus timonensis]
MITHQEARQQATKIVEKMTLAEKIGQINFRAPAITHLNIPEYNYWNEALHGVARAGVATVFPQAIGMAAMFDEKMLKEIGEVIATEGRAKYNQYVKQNDRDIYKGLTFWSPNVNLFRDPRWGRGQETYGEDPYLTARLGVAFIEGLQGNGKYLKLAACAKHFAVHSGPEADRHSFNAAVNQKDLWEFYLPAFEACVTEADVESVMGAYNAVNGTPAVVNHTLLQDILREQWGFLGHVVSDYGALEDVHQHHQYTSDAAETMSLAMKIGCDLCAGNISDALNDAISRHLVTEEEITQAVVSLYATRVRLGMFAEDCSFDEISYEENDSPKHHAISLAAAEKSMVLLKNENFLPLSTQKIKNIAVIGPNARNLEALQGNYFGTSSQYVTFWDGIRTEIEKNGGRAFYALGSHLYKEHAESGLSKENERESEALIAAKHADVAVVCLGLDPTIEGEQGDSGNVYGSGDKYNLSLPGRQKQLLEKILAQGKPVVVVLAAGSALSLDGLENHPNLRAIIQAWYPGSFGGTALANIIFGKVSPSGKLPVTFYKDTSQLPDFNDYSMQERTYQNTKADVLYPFGYGLTYGQAEIKEVTVQIEDDLVKISGQMKNVSSVNIQEVVQVYLKIEGTSLAPKNHKLLSFKRVSLKENEIQNFALEIPVEQLKVVDEKGEKVFDGDKFTFYIGFSQPDERSVTLMGQAPQQILVESLKKNKKPLA